MSLSTALPKALADTLAYDIIMAQRPSPNSQPSVTSGAAVVRAIDDLADYRAECELWEIEEQARELSDGYTIYITSQSIALIKVVFDDTHPVLFLRVVTRHAHLPTPNPASHLGLLSPVPSTTSPTIDGNVALKESIILAARGEIEATASVLAKVKTLEKHINPPYLRGMTRLYDTSIPLISEV